MKNLVFYSLLIICCFSFFTSCGGGDDAGSGSSSSNDYIRIDNNVNNITLGATEKQKMFHVYANCSWSITVNNTNWPTLKVDRTEGSRDADIWLETDENTTPSSRSATLTFKSPGITKTVTITQASGELSLTVTPNKYEFAADGGEYTFTVEGNSNWKVTSQPEWCEIVGSDEGNSGKSYLKVKVGENPNTTAQNGQIIISGETTAMIEVSQQGKAYSLTVSTNALNMSPLGESQSIVITCNGTWRISVDQPWCHVDKVNGASNMSGETITIICDANTTVNERNANVTIVVGNDAKIESIHITQLKGTLPEVTSPQYDRESATELNLSASFSSLFDVTEYGFCYGTSPNPTQKVVVGKDGGKSGNISTTLSVEDGKKYYVRTYAISAVGTNYSQDVEVEMEGQQPGKDDIPSPTI